MKLAERWLVSFLLLIFSFITTVAYVQPLHKPLRYITTKDGLPQSFVSGMVQDKDGFVWIGTPNGLARYDGLHMKLFQHSSSDTTALASNAISWLYVDRQNQIWIYYEKNGLDRFDPVTEKITHVSNGTPTGQNPIVRFHLATHDSCTWTSRNDGLYLHDPKLSGTTHFSAKGGQIASDTVLAMLEDRQNRIWSAGLAGISLYQPEARRFRLFPFSYPLRLGTLRQVVLHERSNGELMLRDAEKLFIFNPENGRYRTIPLPQNAPVGKLLMQTGSNGTDYIETEETLYRYDDRHGLVPVLKVSDFSIWAPTALLVDRSGLLWLGLNINGIAQFDLAATVFDVYPNAGAFHRAYLLKEFGSGVMPFLARAFPEYADSTSSGVPNYLFRSAWDSRTREFWVGYKDQVARYDPNSQQWQMLPPVPGYLLKTSVGPGGLRGISIDPGGRPWVMDERSVCYFDGVKQEWKTYINTTEKGMDTTLLFYSAAIQADGEKLWITPGSGLVCIDVATRRIDVFNDQTKPVLLPTNQLLGMEPDPTRPYLLWIGSREGLICLNKKTLTTEVFTTKQGLPDKTIYAIQTDKNGYLWLSTNQGLCRFHPVTHTVRNFTIQNGLPGNEFNTLQYLKLKNGRLAFGGVDGWVAFDPTVIKQDTFQPQIAFTGLKIYNEPVNYLPGNKLLPQPLNDIETLVLPYDQNTLTFEFAGLQYNQPAGLKYRYRLEGYDNKWITTDNPVAGYTKLAPGYYTLHINCTNTTGQWSNHVRSLAIRILPPWWRTWWAYTLYALIIAGIGYALYRGWLQRIRAKQQIVLQQKEAEQLKVLDEMKSRFFSNITHEFRTPLSLILAPAEQLQKEVQVPEQKKQVGTIQHNARQMLQLINQLLDMAKLEANSMKVALFRGNINQFVQDQLQPFIIAAAAKNIAVQFNGNHTDDEYLFDADKLHTILSNLLSNAIKFTPSGGSILVTIHQEDADNVTTFRFTVQDSGIGIPADKLPHIFNRFYQVDDSRTRSYEGTGIGLALAKELAELMKGTLTVASEPATGTIFTLMMALSKATDATAPAYEMKQAEATALLPVENSISNEQPAQEALVLIVEDNKELNEFIAQTFRKHYRVITAVNGAEGWQMAREELPDMIISDLMMPEMDGYAFCKAVKENPATNHIAFLLLTGKAAQISKMEGLQSGADDYLTKPFVAEELQLRVSNILKRQQQLRHYYQQQLMEQSVAEMPRVAAAEMVADPFLHDLYAIVEANLDDSAFSVDKLATKAAVSTRTLNRKLSTLIGLPPSELIKNYRLKRATEFLKQGKGVAETTYEVGYESPANFSTLFKSVYGVAPSEYVKERTR